MSKKPLKHFLLLLICTATILITGLHVFNMNQIVTVKDTVYTIIFFASLFPFSYSFIEIFGNSFNVLIRTIYNFYKQKAIKQ